MTDVPKSKDVQDGDEISPCGFVPEKVLKSGGFGCVQGILSGQQSLLLVEQREFTPSDLLSEAYSGRDLQFEKLFHNDIYSRYILYPKAPFNGIKASLISPCTEKHIDKYREHISHLVLETPERYRDITLKHIQEDQFDLQWVYNILSGEKEADRVLFRDDSDPEKGFILAPDLHWDGKDPDSLHLLALPIKRNILSIRDLDQNHLPLLRYVRDKSIEIIDEKYNIKSSRLRMYFHYQPTFYHLHVHITYIRHEAPGIFVEKAHLLDTVINNIELINDYYKRATLPFTVRETDKLFSKYKDAGVISENGN